MKQIVSALLLLAAFLPGASRAALPPERLQGTVELKDAYRNVHPRLVCDQADLDRLAARFKENPEAFKTVLPSPTDPSLLKVFSLNDHNAPTHSWYLMTDLPGVALAYRITGDPRYLDLLGPWFDAIAKMTPMKPEVMTNTDLMDGHIMASLALLYDLLKGAVPPEKEQILRDAMVRQGAILYADFIARSSVTYEQNHCYIPIAGLGLASLALMDEVPEAKAWAVVSRNMMDISRQLICSDGYYFEGGGYWNFCIVFQTLYAAALRHATGEDWLTGPNFTRMPLYVLHMNTPDGRQMFDFADVDPDKGDPKKWHDAYSKNIFVSPIMPLLPGGAAPLAGPAVAWLQAFETFNHQFKALCRMVWDDGDPRSAPIPVPAAATPAYHYFADHEVIAWRENWSDPMATGFAFKCGPPEGHTTVPMMAKYPDWRPEPSHPHPDAGSFLLYSHGVYLANTTRYTDKKLSANENCILIDGQGQSKEGTAFGTFRAGPFPKYDKIRMKDVWLGSTVMAATGVTEDAYDDSLQCQAVYRHLMLVEGRWLVVRDYLRAGVPHVWQFLYHTDQEPQPAGENRWTMVNGAGRVVIQSLQAIEQKLPVGTAEVAPTLVVPHPAPADGTQVQRGYHLGETSPSVKEFRFLNAVTIGSSATPADRISAKVGENGEVEFHDGDDACSLWLNKSAVLAGQWAYRHDQDGKCLGAGLDGTSLKLKDGFALALTVPGEVVVKRTADGWSAEARMKEAAGLTLQLPGEEAKTVSLPAGESVQAF